MGQRLLLGLAAALIGGALVIGAVGAAQGGWSPIGAPAAGGMMGGYGRGGMMGGQGAGGMLGGYGPGGMMGGYYGQAPANGQAISIDQAQKAVEAYVAATGVPNLALDEVIEFQDNFYAIVKEKDTGTGAFEVLVNRATGAVTPEPGPNMMWNTRYGMAGRGMMGGLLGQSGSMTVSRDRAGQIAQSWLDANRKGATIEEPDTFHGYYTVHFTQDGKVAGMLSVNGYTGQVWYHSWHGAFIQERQV